MASLQLKSFTAPESAKPFGKARHNWELWFNGESHWIPDSDLTNTKTGKRMVHFPAQCLNNAKMRQRKGQFRVIRLEKGQLKDDKGKVLNPTEGGYVITPSSTYVKSK